MKQVVSGILTVCMLLMLCACGPSRIEQPVEQPAEQPVDEKPSSVTAPFQTEGAKPWTLEELKEYSGQDIVIYEMQEFTGQYILGIKDYDENKIKPMFKPDNPQRNRVIVIGVEGVGGDENRPTLSQQGDSLIQMLELLHEMKALSEPGMVGFSGSEFFYQAFAEANKEGSALEIAVDPHEASLAILFVVTYNGPEIFTDLKTGGSIKAYSSSTMLVPINLMTGEQGEGIIVNTKLTNSVPTNDAFYYAPLIHPQEKADAAVFVQFLDALEKSQGY